MFAWNPVEMSGVFWEVTEHTLNIKPGSKLIKQGLRRFNQEKRRAMGEELSRLLAANFCEGSPTPMLDSQSGPCAEKE
jgi:hypothetical protein